MNITVTATKSQPPAKTPYPMMMESVGGDRMIVYFRNYRVGTLVFIGKEDEDHKIFTEYDDWVHADDKDHWKPYTGEIIIKSR